LPFPPTPRQWYDDKYSMADVKKAWDNLLTALGGRWNLMGLDLKNEPHGKATWGFGNKKTDWCVWGRGAVVRCGVGGPVCGVGLG
jgi:aryl-phospho-beta-D-glucosidase BglC (GH1 family)